jgi:hypothetical protein
MRLISSNRTIRLTVSFVRMRALERRGNARGVFANCRVVSTTQVAGMETLSIVLSYHSERMCSTVSVCEPTLSDIEEY